jgi:uncharacterized phage protein gp47/JayE
MTTNVPAIQFTTAGLVLPTDAAILAGVQLDIDAAFGGGVNPGLSTPQGQLASSWAAIISDKNAQIALLVNQINPQFSSGRMQDAIGNIYFMTRYPSLPTSVVCTLVGAVGTSIPVGSQAVADDDSVYICTEAVVIPGGGSIDATFECLLNGPTSCPSGTLNRIYQAIPGWDTITNAADGVIGRNTETSAEFEYRRQQSVAANATGSLPSIYGALFAVDNVIDVYCTENVTDSPVVNGNQTLAAHSLWACVAGGAAEDIAQAIWSKKSPGCNYNGDTTVVVYDTSGYDVPRPQYNVSYWTATPTPLLFHVTIANTPYLPADVSTLIKNAIIAACAGLDGGAPARIGSTQYAFRFVAPVLATATPGTVIQILSIAIGISSATLPSVTMGIDQVPTVDASDITVTLT